MISLVEVSGKAYSDRKQLRVSTEGLQFLQAIKGPVAVLSIVGQPKSGKSALLRRLLECKDCETTAFSPQSTFGLLAYSEVLKITHVDELGNQKVVSVLMVDTEGIMARGELTLATQLFALTALLSSHMLYWT